MSAPLGSRRQTRSDTHRSTIGPGWGITSANGIDRKRVLEALLDNTQGVQLIKYVDHIAGNGELVLEHACKLGLERIVSKRADALVSLRPQHRLGSRRSAQATMPLLKWWETIKAGRALGH